MWLFGKPNIKNLQKQKDFEKLGELLKHQDSNIRVQSSMALYELMTDSNISLANRNKIPSLFDNVHDDKIAQFFKEKLEQRLEANTGYYLNGLLAWIMFRLDIYWLIDFQKRLNDLPKVRGGFFHSDISEVLLSVLNLLSGDSFYRTAMLILPHACNARSYANIATQLEIDTKIVVSPEKYQELKFYIDQGLEHSYTDGVNPPNKYRKMLLSMLVVKDIN